jgi:hypothetical protein
MPFRVERDISLFACRRPPIPHLSPGPSRRREGGESPSDVRVAGQNSLGRQPSPVRNRATQLFGASLDGRSHAKWLPGDGRQDASYVPFK